MDKVFNVTQVNTYVKQIFEVEEFLINIKVQGEVSGFKISNGVAYFCLKDENSILNCVCFNRDLFNILEEGNSTIVTGSFNYYIKGGRLSFNVIKAEKSGLGELFNKFLKLKQKLEEEGLFSELNKKKLPKEIKTIGVITSETGAVIQDIINVSTRRNPNINIVLYPVRVQGNNAELEIIQGIKFFDKYDKVDLIIVARGGGSLEDLAPFNTESLARSIYECNKFVLSAVGHETDYTICDFVSDLRAPTPSAAAEIVTIDKSSKKSIFVNNVNRLYNLSRNFCINEITKLKYNLSYLNSLEVKLYNYKLNNFTKNKNSLINKLESFIVLKEKIFDLINVNISSLNPKRILNLGYSVVENNKGEVINNINQINSKDNLKINLKNGIIKVTVD